MKFQLVRSPRKQIDTNFGCKALSFQLISIVSLLNLSSCDSNILKVNISDVYEREVRNVTQQKLHPGYRASIVFSYVL